jgi:hypothetical protein
MRTQHLKLTKGHSTKSERKLMELFKKHHIPFKAKVLINKREIDFLLGNYAIELDAHIQDWEKNKMLIEYGLIPLHYHNWEITPQVESWLVKIGKQWQEQV